MNTVKCPKCGSDQITANPKGFSSGKAAAGVILTGGIGLLAGTIGKNKIIITCLACGNQFTPQENAQRVANNAMANARAASLLKRNELKKSIANKDFTGEALTPEEIGYKRGVMYRNIFFAVICILALYLLNK